MNLKGCFESRVLEYCSFQVYVPLNSRAPLSCINAGTKHFVSVQAILRF